MKQQTIAIIGLGYVGLPLAITSRKHGYRVIGVDINRTKVDSILNGVLPFDDDHVQRELLLYPIEATTDFSILSKASIIIICVPTPVYESKLPNYTPLSLACGAIAAHLKVEQVVILESTVNPGLCEELIIPALESGSGLKCGNDFSVAHCPERINPGDQSWRVENIPRVVGGYDEKSLAKAVSFYESIIDAKIYPVASLKEAEAVKVVENSFRNINIAFVNELAQSFASMGIDVVNVINAAATKPFAFMPHFPGCGVGGHCIPLDPHYLIDYAKQQGFDHELLKLACRVNDGMPAYTVDLLEKKMNEAGLKLAGSTVAVLGLSYKANVDDARESPAHEIIKQINNRGGKVNTYDPHCASLSSSDSLTEVFRGATAAVVTVAHDEFVQKVTPDLLQQNHVGILVDGRNCLNKQGFQKSGITYVGIGR